MRKLSSGFESTTGGSGSGSLLFDPPQPSKLVLCRIEVPRGLVRADSV